MSALHLLLDIRLFQALAGTPLSASQRDRVVDLCESVVTIAGGTAHPGRTARSAVELMLEISAPALDAGTRAHLARLCEVAAVRGVTPA